MCAMMATNISIRSGLRHFPGYSQGQYSAQYGFKSIGQVVKNNHTYREKHQKQHGSTEQTINDRVGHGIGYTGTATQTGRQ